MMQDQPDSSSNTSGEMSIDKTIKEDSINRSNIRKKTHHSGPADKSLTLLPNDGKTGNKNADANIQDIDDILRFINGRPVKKTPGEGVKNKVKKVGKQFWTDTQNKKILEISKDDDNTFPILESNEKHLIATRNSKTEVPRESQEIMSSISCSTSFSEGLRNNSNDPYEDVELSTGLVTFPADGTRPDEGFIAVVHSKKRKGKHKKIPEDLSDAILIKQYSTQLRANAPVRETRAASRNTFVQCQTPSDGSVSSSCLAEVLVSKRGNEFQKTVGNERTSPVCSLRDLTASTSEAFDISNSDPDEWPACVKSSNFTTSAEQVACLSSVSPTIASSMTMNDADKVKTDISCTILKNLNNCEDLKFVPFDNKFVERFDMLDPKRNAVRACGNCNFTLVSVSPKQENEISENGLNVILDLCASQVTVGSLTTSKPDNLPYTNDSKLKVDELFLIEVIDRANDSSVVSDILANISSSLLPDVMSIPPGSQHCDIIFDGRNIENGHEYSHGGSPVFFDTRNKTSLSESENTGISFGFDLSDSFEPYPNEESLSGNADRLSCITNFVDSQNAHSVISTEPSYEYCGSKSSHVLMGDDDQCKFRGSPRWKNGDVTEREMTVDSTFVKPVNVRFADECNDVPRQRQCMQDNGLQIFRRNTRGFDLLAAQAFMGRGNLAYIVYMTALFHFF